MTTTTTTYLDKISAFADGPGENHKQLAKAILDTLDLMFCNRMDTVAHLKHLAKMARNQIDDIESGWEPCATDELIATAASRVARLKTEHRALFDRLSTLSNLLGVLVDGVDGEAAFPSSALYAEHVRTLQAVDA